MLSREEFFEEGIVEVASGGIAQVKITRQTGCEECSARVFCSSNTHDNIVAAVDSLGARRGDHVKIAVPGRYLTYASTLLYSIPLLLLLAGILAGSLIFNLHREILSSVLSVILIGMYAAILYFYQNRKDKSFLMPRIISIKTRAAE